MAEPVPPQAPPQSGALVPATAPAPLTHRERLAQFKILEEKRHDLIEELIEKLEKTEARLAQTELDLNSEQNVRRTLQAEVAEAKAKEEALVQLQTRRPFVLVLIDGDADGFLFLDKYITKKTQGGEALADELLVKIREYLRPKFEDADTLDIIVRVYANLEGMANYLVRLDKVRNLGQLRAFSTGFCGRISSFDWIDTGVGKEGSSARKVRENLSFYLSNVHLRHTLIGLSPTDLPPTLLSTLPLDKLTLLQTTPQPLPPATASQVNLHNFPTIFHPPTPPPQPSHKAQSKSRGRNGPQLQLRQQDDENGGSTWLVIQPERSKSQAPSRGGNSGGSYGGNGGGGNGRRGASDDENASLSISIGPDNTVSVDSGRRRRIMG